MDFRQPNINAPTTEGQLKQLKTYLYQLTNQLNYAVKSAESKDNEERYKVTISGKSNGSGANSSDISDDNNARSTFNDLKDMIIKSADIVNAYYDVISKRLEGEYTALARTEEGYDAFVEDTKQFREMTPVSNTDYFNSVQSIYKVLGHEIEKDENGNPIIPEDAILTGIRTDKFYIKTGWVDEVDGKKIGGIELGQVSDDGTNTDAAFAQFTTEALVFKDSNGKAVATLSYDLLDITNAKIGGYLALNNYMLDNSDGIAFLWAGDE